MVHRPHKPAADSPPPDPHAPFPRAESPFPEADDELFFELLQRPRSEWESCLRATCGDETRRRELLSLLEAHSLAGTFLQTPALDLGLHAALLQDDLPDDLEGATLGHYLVGERIGAGGMGVVYLARRADQAFEKQVAIKVIKRGMDSEDILRRFHLERQLLADLDHPNIARLIDGGATDDGRPYLVMEHVRGVPLDRYRRQHDLSIPARLRLFRDCCAAVEHAHRALVVHRDLKPGNILVTDDGRVKLLDFGIAKILSSPDDAPFQTRADSPVLTPRYASPEQLRGERATTAADVYSLGVILYELLTGEHPYAPNLTSRADLERAMQGPEPPRPSARVLMRESPDRAARALSKRLKGDLDTIVMTAMHRSPDRRYRSVEQLNDDIQRHLTGIPVRARPDSLTYRAGKFIRRHAVPVAAAAALLVVLLLGLTTTTVLYRQARAAELAADEQRIRAERQAQIAKRTSAFLERMLASADPRNARGGDVGIMCALVDDAAMRATAELADWPEVAAAVHLTIGTTYEGLDLLDQAEIHLTRALELHLATYGPDAPETARARTALGRLARTRGDRDRAESEFNHALAIYRAIDPHSTETASSLCDLANIRRDRGDFTAAAALQRDAVALLRARDDRAALAGALTDLATTMSDASRPADAEPLLREAVAILEELHGEGPHAQTAEALASLGMCLRRLRQYDEAETLLRRWLQMRRDMAPRHHQVAVAADSLASLLEDMSRYDEAEPLYLEALGMQIEILGPRHRNVGTTYNNLGGLCLKTGRLDQAHAHYEKALDIYRETLGPDHLWTSIVLENMVLVHEERGTLPDAAPLIEECLRIRTAALPPTSRMVLTAQSLAAALAAEQGRIDDAAEEFLLKSCADIRAARGDTHDMAQRAIRRVARYYHLAGREKEAAEYANLLTR